jgi:hypothetical protein
MASNATPPSGHIPLQTLSAVRVSYFQYYYYFSSGKKKKERNIDIDSNFPLRRAIRTFLRPKAAFQSPLGYDLIQSHLLNLLRAAFKDNLKPENKDHLIC